jgi:hypothetical protein
MHRILARAALVAGIALSALASQPAAAADTAAEAVVPPATAAEAFFNVDRSYPTSCLQAPLALGAWQNDPNHVQKNIDLYGDSLSTVSGENGYHETVSATVFRVPCTGGTSATLLEIDRTCTSTGTCPTTYPTMPRVSVQQGGLNLTIRIAKDPNTFYSNVYERAPMYASSVFVLENVYGAHNAGVFFDYGQPFTLTLNNLQSSNNTVSFALPVYTASQYPNAALNLPITGYLTTNWANDKQDNDGIVVQVYDGGDFSTRIFAFAWFTYDNNHAPFWLFGQGSLTNGSRTVTVPVNYYTGGTFAPATHTTATSHTWGTATFTFSDCSHMSVQYTGDASAVQGPTGTGTATFTRAGYVNSIVCI